MKEREREREREWEREFIKGDIVLFQTQRDNMPAIEQKNHLILKI